MAEPYDVGGKVREAVGRGVSLPGPGIVLRGSGVAVVGEGGGYQLQDGSEGEGDVRDEVLGPVDVDLETGLLDVARGIARASRLSPAIRITFLSRAERRATGDDKIEIQRFRGALQLGEDPR